MEEERLDKIKYASLSMQQFTEALMQEGGAPNAALKSTVNQWFEETIKAEFPNIDAQVLLVIRGIMMVLLEKFGNVLSSDASSISQLDTISNLDPDAKVKVVAEMLQEMSSAIMQALRAIHMH